MLYQRLGSDSLQKFIKIIINFMERKNIFQLWKENGEQIPFKVIKDSWDENKHFAVIERIEIGKWPYGKAYGQYFFHGKAGEKGLISASGTYAWKIKKE